MNGRFERGQPDGHVISREPLVAGDFITSYDETTQQAVFGDGSIRNVKPHDDRLAPSHIRKGMAFRAVHSSVEVEVVRRIIPYSGTESVQDAPVTPRAMADMDQSRVNIVA